MLYQDIFQKIEIVYQDDFIIVLNKPSGLTVNRSITQKDGTLQDYVESKFDFLSKAKASIDSEFVSRSGIVHRLDKDTSGLILVAKDPKSFVNLQSQFREREIVKDYLAVVVGKMSEDNMNVAAPIQRNPQKRMTYAVVAKGKPAETRIARIKELKLEDSIFTLVTASPKTGRTHQIRVHLFALNIPVACDRVYSSKKQFELSSLYFNRLMLHAYKISFIHPKTKHVVDFTCPPSKEFHM